MVPKPSWLRFKRWRSKGAPRDQCERQLSAGQSGEPLDEPAASAATGDELESERTGLRLISEQPNPAQRASSGERRHEEGPSERALANHQATAAADDERGRSNRRRLCELMPRALTQLIERSVSPNVRRTNTDNTKQQQQQQPRAKSPLRKLQKHLKPSQAPASGSLANRDEPQKGLAAKSEAGQEKRTTPEAIRANSGRNHQQREQRAGQRPPPVEISNVQRECNERGRPDCDSSSRVEATEANELDQQQQRQGCASGQALKPLVTGGQIRPAHAGASPLCPLEGAYNRSVNEVTRPASANDHHDGLDEAHHEREREQRQQQQQQQRQQQQQLDGQQPNASSAPCQLSAKTRDRKCALHGSNVALCRLQQAGNEPSTGPRKRAAGLDGEGGGAGTKSELEAAKVDSVAAAAANTSHKAAAKRKRRTPREKARSVSTWPLAKQTLDNNLPNEFRLGHFGDCEDLLSAHLAGRLFGALTAHDLISIQSQQAPARLQFCQPQPGESEPRLIASDNHRPDHQLAFECQQQQQQQRRRRRRRRRQQQTTTENLFDQLIFQATSDALKLADRLRAFNYNHKRPFALPFETPSTGWLFNATGLQPINSGSAHTLRAKLFASNKFRRRSYDDQEGDNDINIILQPSDIDDIEKRARLAYARLKATTTMAQNVGQPRAATTATTNNDQDPQTKTTITNTRHPLNQKSRHPSQQAHKLKAFDGIFEDIKLAKCLLDQDYNQTVRLFIERSALNWNFNSFTFDALCCGRSLTELLLHLFDYYNLYAIFNLDIIKVLKCFRLLEFGYHSTNPYHNSVHAADVTQAMHCFIQEQKIRSHMTDLEILCSILAAVCHDLDHPGVNQSFLVATNNPLASLYQNNSVLENHHWRFALCIFKESKLFDHFDELVLDDMKQQLKQLILATDIARQNDYLKRFKALTSSKQFSMSNTEDRALVLQMALKCADLGNPCRPWLISRVWSNLICDEFYRMGQIERRLGVPLTPICQRNKTSIAGIQTDFFRFIVLPLLELWHDFLSSPLSDLLMANFDHNYQRWQRANRIVQQLRRRKSVASLEPVGDLPDDDVSSGIRQEQVPITGKQVRSLSLIQSSLVEALAGAGSLRQRRDSFELIKRASSDYVKSGNGRLETLRDFQLNRIIEKSPIISRLVIEPLN